MSVLVQSDVSSRATPRRRVYMLLSLLVISKYFVSRFRAGYDIITVNNRHNDRGRNGFIQLKIDFISKNAGSFFKMVLETLFLLATSTMTITNNWPKKRCPLRLLRDGSSNRLEP